MRFWANFKLPRIKIPFKRKQKIDFFCEECSSKDIVFHSVAYWDIVKQSFEFAAVRTHRCQNCEAVNSAVAADIDTGEVIPINEL